MFKRRSLPPLFSMLFCMSTMHAMVFDNRFFPLYSQPFLSHIQATWEYSLRAAFWGSRHSFGGGIEETMVEGDSLPLFRIDGPYDQVLLDKALQDAHITSGSLFRSDMRTISSLPYRPQGQLSLKGLVFESFLRLGSSFGLGISMLAGKVKSHLELERDCGRPFSLGEEEEILLVNKKIHETLGLKPPCYSAPVFGDIDLYARWYTTRDYWYRINHLDVGLDLGLLIPTAPAVDINNPASIPIGGNKHFGMYGAFEGTFVLKEDVTVALLLRVNKRFARTSVQRMPFNGEPLNYGVLTGCARVNPGPTVIFSPRVQLDGLRDGLGLNVAYFLVYHFKDHWTDMRKDKSAPANIEALESRSIWGSDYFSVTAYYDFGYDKPHAWCAPIISLTVDVPFQGAVTQRVSKTHGISLRIESRL